MCARGELNRAIIQLNKKGIIFSNICYAGGCELKLKLGSYRATSTRSNSLINSLDSRRVVALIPREPHYPFPGWKFLTRFIPNPIHAARGWIVIRIRKGYQPVSVSKTITHAGTERDFVPFRRRFASTLPRERRVCNVLTVRGCFVPGGAVPALVGVNKQ